METLTPLPAYDLASLWPHANALSSSQLVEYLKDPAEFYIRYANGVGKDSQAMQIGRIFSAAYADRKLNYEPHLREAGCDQRFITLFGQALAKFPIIKGGKPEYPMKCKVNGWTIRATLDDIHIPSAIIIENKTGKVKWTEARAHTSPQISIQSFCFWKKHDKLPKHTQVNWWNTGIKSHAHIETFITKRSVSQLKDCEELVVEVIENIKAGNFSNPII